MMESKKSFGPTAALGAHIKASNYQMYASGLIFAAALTLNQNPFFESDYQESIVRDLLDD